MFGALRFALVGFISHFEVRYSNWCVCRYQGIATTLAAISSLNDKSLAFHRRHGFTEVGRFREVGQKMNRLFDVVWMQKML